VGVAVLGTVGEVVDPEAAEVAVPGTAVVEVDPGTVVVEDDLGTVVVEVDPGIVVVAAFAVAVGTVEDSLLGEVYLDQWRRGVEREVPRSHTPVFPTS